MAETEQIDQRTQEVKPSTPDAGVTGSADAGLAGSEDWKAKHDAAVAQARDERQKRQELESRLFNLEQQIAVRQANPPQPQKSLSQQIATELGYGEESYLTTEQICRVNDELVRRVSTQQFVNSHSDYGQVVGTNVAGQFQPSTDLYELLASGNPAVYAAIQTGPTAVYPMVKQYQELKALRAQNQQAADKYKEAEIANKVHVSTVPISPGSAAAAGRVTPGARRGPLTVDEMAAMDARIEAGEFET